MCVCEIKSPLKSCEKKTNKIIMNKIYIHLFNEYITQKLQHKLNRKWKIRWKFATVKHKWNKISKWSVQFSPFVIVCESNDRKHKFRYANNVINSNLNYGSTSWYSFCTWIDNFVAPFRFYSFFSSSDFGVDQYRKQTRQPKLTLIIQCCVINQYWLIQSSQINSVHWKNKDVCCEINWQFKLK